MDEIIYALLTISTIIDIADQDHWSTTKGVYTGQAEFELCEETVI